ncbi:DUF1868 domain-containing protein [Vallitalea sp.]|jgi:hypothetical protein|uniref:DUF1868 domain-containing protein n=1 Tax=Vallitalea sp. TaxID=1882829 RepID=UPI0025D25481|nr:DUF1868 domain-containing protein [Vallitalea sp.]MCT4686697.1 DUF1868 domain-containing protein [Vallitalea sp.]
MKKSSNCEAKFYKNGDMKYFPGNTIVNMLLENPLREVLASVQNYIKGLSFADKCAFLPVDSFHMTIFSILTQQALDKDSDILPEDIKQLNNMQEIDEYIAGRLSAVKIPQSIEMTIVEFSINKIILKPKTKRDHELLWTYIENVSNAIGMKLNEDYKFHISIAYLMDNLTDEEVEEWHDLKMKLTQDYSKYFSSIIIDRPIFAVFNDMSEFRKYGAGREHLGIYIDSEQSVKMI